MKALWFVPVRNYYSPTRNDYNGGGWISSLENTISKREDVKLAIAFYDTTGQTEKMKSGETLFYPIPLRNYSTLKKIKQAVSPLSFQIRQKIIDTQRVAKEVINEYKPDVIQIFGTESAFGIIAEITDIPCVIHLQGILSASINAWLPPFFSWRDFILQSYYPATIKYLLGEKLSWERNAIIETQIFKRCHNFIGRTDWDRKVTNILSPKAKYYHCDEILRDTFYISAERKLPEHPVFVSTISYMLYKGFDLILKTAKILKEDTNLPFEWRVYGNLNPTFVEKQIGIRHEDANVKLMGVATPDELKEVLLHATAYVHPSYIENSSNAIGESQILGVTAVCTNVGGSSSLVENNKTGFLVPANHPFDLAYILKHIYNNPELNLKIGRAAREEAMQRHDPIKICNDLISIYNNLISKKNGPTT